MLKRFARKDREKRRLELEVRISVNSEENEPVGFIHEIVGGPSSSKGKNKRASENVLTVEKNLWTR